MISLGGKFPVHFHAERRLFIYYCCDLSVSMVEHHLTFDLD